MYTYCKCTCQLKILNFEQVMFLIKQGHNYIGDLRHFMQLKTLTNNLHITLLQDQFSIIVIQNYIPLNWILHYTVEWMEGHHRIAGWRQAVDCVGDVSLVIVVNLVEGVESHLYLFSKLVPREKLLKAQGVFLYHHNPKQTKYNCTKYMNYIMCQFKFCTRIQNEKKNENEKFILKSSIVTNVIYDIHNDWTFQ